MTLFHDLQQDARFYHHLRFPGMQPTVLSWTQILFSSPGLFVVAVNRIGYFNELQQPTGATKWLSIAASHLGMYLAKVCAKCDVVSSTRLEPGVYLSDSGHIILGARSIGTGTIIHERVTIGMNLMNSGIPEIGRNVWIGSHSVISGDIRIGDGVTVLPGTVLTKSLPPGVVVQGNPARILKRDFDNAALRRTLTIDIEQFIC